MFYKVEVPVDEEGNVLVNLQGDPELKVPNPKVELPYTYLIASIYLLDSMVYYALSILNDGSTGIKRLCALPAEVGALKLATPIYVLYQENHSE